MQQKVTTSLAIALMLTIAVVVGSETEQAPKTRQDAPSSKGTRDYQPEPQFEPRFAMNQLPSAGNSLDSYLKYCEAVIHAMESELPRKSIFRSLFVDKSRLASGYDKHVKFSYYDLLKNLPGQEY